MFIGKIQKPTKQTLVEDNSEYINVPVKLYQVEGEQELYIETKNLSFPLASKPEYVTAEVDKYVAMLNADKAHTEQNAAHEEAHKQADETIEALTPKE